ncbi:ABC transporter substrate-binding protein [Pantoea osteomyelitidis]|uniref:ABC transporter substrate-binding protein n=1 Tax=Pantoea osteomyelitidis TaxID=3230026 RepID=A0ABW7Q047_9GAMM
MSTMSYSAASDACKRGFLRFSQLMVTGALCVNLLSVSAQAETLKLLAGSTPSSRPTCFMDMESGKFEGFMPEIAQEVAKRAGFEVSFNAIPFSTLLQSLLSDKIDMIVAGMSPTDQRKTKVDFSDGITSVGEGIYARDDNKKQYRSPADFKGEAIGIMAGTDYGRRISEMNVAKEIKFYESAADLARDVSLGRVSVGMNDYPIIKGQASIGALKGMHVVESYQSTKVAPIAFALRKGNEPLLLKINQAIESMKQDGSLQKILNKWGMQYIPA